jgi:hypothetical protein
MPYAPSVRQLSEAHQIDGFWAKRAALLRLRSIQDSPDLWSRLLDRHPFPMGDDVSRT